MASNKMLIDASHPEETRVVVLRGNRIEEFDFESQNKRQLKGNIYLAKVTRVEPSLQAAFVDYGGNRHGFLAFNEIHPDYYQIPVADRQALLAEEAADARRANNDDANGDDDIEPEIAEEPDVSDEGVEEVDASTDDSSSDTEPEEEDKKPKRRSRRSRRKTSVAADSAGDSDDNSPDEESPDEENDEKPASIAAMMETDSISQPVDDDSDGEDSGEDDEAADKPAKKRARSTRRPRKSAKTADQKSEEKSEEKSDKAEEPAPEPAELSDAADSDATDEEAKPKTRRKRAPRAKKSEGSSRSTKKTPRRASAKKSNEDNNDNDGDVVETTGRGDAMEEVPQRKRPRRQYNIQEVVKRRQVLLVQVVKEERGNKGAALTTYLSLAGRYSVLMPNTARGGGISRKITQADDRRRLKKIAGELEVPEGMGVILRTAGASRTKAEIQRDFEYLMRLWENVRALTLSSSAPCLVYEEGSLIKRSIRDLYDKNTGEVLVAGEAGHKEASDFMEMLMPAHAAKVKLYTEPQAMFARFGVEQQLDRMLGQQVTLKSGGYLVIDQTEALVAIDVNSGRATREHSIEETALQTNLETAEEVARQLRLRDLAGLIVIDFIDMEEKRNNRAVEKKLKECLKHDRARIQVGRISHFGLMEMSRQRMRASVLESTMDICPHCQGKGHMRSNSSASLHILRAIEEHLLTNSRFDLLVKAAGETVLYILNHKRPALVEIESRYGVKILIEESRELNGDNFTLEKGEPASGERKAATFIQAGSPTADASEKPDSNDSSGVGGESTSSDTDTDQPAKRKRRRRRGRGNRDDATSETSGEAQETNSQSADDDEGSKEQTPNNDASEDGNRRKRSRGKRAGRNSRNTRDTPDADDAVSAEAESVETVAESAEPAPEVSEAPKTRNSRPRKAKPKAEPDAEAEPETSAKEATAEANSDEPSRPKRRTTRRQPASEDDKVLAAEANPADTVKSSKDTPPDASTEEADGAGEGEKRGGWWSRTGFFK